ncbi:MAG: carboxypeptidase-like regulatory domain-containing protein [Bacteroidales bacterium]|nr:carboxypeptidase-like regulatory domain-containing protein [Bacteroidales bacterium]
MQSRIIILGIFLTTLFSLHAQNKVRLTVLDSITGTPVENAAIFLKHTTLGTLTDYDGKAEIIHHLSGSDSVEIRLLGYRTLTVPVNSYNDNIIRIAPSGIDLNEIVVKKRKEHYSKHNNPAVELMRSIRERNKDYSPSRHVNFAYDQYEKFTISLYNIKAFNNSNSTDKHFFLKEFIDTVPGDSTKILVISLKEKVSHVQRTANTSDEVIISQRSEGIDEFMDQTSIHTVLTETIREIDPYDGTINILNSRFVGPLSSIGPDFYKYYITDTIKRGDKMDIELSFVPRVSSTHGFTGKFIVAVSDSTFFIKSVKMGLPKEANVNFVEKLNLTQDFNLDSTATRIKTKEQLDVVLSLIPGTQSILIQKYLELYKHNYNIVKIPVDVIIETQNSNWEDIRKQPLTGGESKIGLMMETYRRKPVLYWSEQVIRALINGYIPTSRSNNKFSFGPLNTLVSANSIEGLRVRVGGMTTANLSKNWFNRGYVAYGFKDKKLKYRGEIEYSFNEKKEHSREFPIHSLRVSHLYDVDMLGQHYLFTNSDNVFLSWKRMKNILMTYHRVSEFIYTREYLNNFSFAVSLKHELQESTRYLPFITAEGNKFRNYSEVTTNVELRYAPGEKFYQMKSERIPINKDAPIFTLRHTIGPRNVLGNKFTVNRTEASIQNRFWFSAFGHLDILIKGGYTWSSVPYPSLFIPNANLSYTIQPESFALMNPMEFIANTYGSWFVTYNADGALLNYLPLLKKLRLREVISCRGYYGTLNKGNNPEYNRALFLFPEAVKCTDMKKTPYVEASVGIDNILRCLRIDYVWRVTYRGIPFTDRNGVRIAFHASF